MVSREAFLIVLTPSLIPSPHNNQNPLGVIKVFVDAPLSSYNKIKLYCVLVLKDIPEYSWLCALAAFS